MRKAATSARGGWIKYGAAFGEDLCAALLGVDWATFREREMVDASAEDESEADDTDEHNVG
jgi:hypothetical protein